MKRKIKRKCLKCPSRDYYNSLCRKHFMEQIIKRVRKEIREKGLIKKDDVLVVKDPICRFFIKKCMSGMPLKIINKDRKNAKHVVLWTLDDEVLSFLTGFFSGKAAQENAMDYEKYETPCIEIKPFRNVKEDELAAFARLIKVKFKKRKRQKEEEEMKKWFEKMEKKHPETRFSLLKSVEEAKKLNS